MAGKTFHERSVTVTALVGAAGIGIDHIIRSRESGGDTESFGRCNLNIHESSFLPDFAGPRFIYRAVPIAAPAKRAAMIGRKCIPSGRKKSHSTAIQTPVICPRFSVRAIEYLS